LFSFLVSFLFPEIIMSVNGFIFSSRGSNNLKVVFTHLNKSLNISGIQYCQTYS
jgi:hypothetical protein